ncbi:MAG: RNA polymerase factor sigma-32 [Deltaproteobacteria bacterium]|nr:RNA polymerase factor sigma-32 [Deltaproteobacteria bacterium]MCW5804848.1 RNA polymerase factor sigma-32 [Deltaproteobacteria bacterium]
MAGRKPKTGAPAGKKKPVIDVGAPAAVDEDEDEDGKEEKEEKEEEEGVDVDLASNVIDVDDAATGGDEGGDAAEEAPEPRSAGAGSLARRDPMAAYMREVRRYPLLTPEEEKALAVKLVEHGDTAAAKRLIEANLRLVVKIAYEYRRAHKNLLDLVQEGNIGLIQAVSKFDPYRGVKLSSYAAFWIRAYILKFILNNWRLVKIGTTQAQRKLFFNLRKEREKLEQLGFQPTAALLAEKLDVPEREVIEMERRLAAPEASLDAPLGGGDDDGTRTRLDYIPSDTERPDRAVAQSEFSNLLKGHLEAFARTLEGREQTIFRERWLTDEPLTLQELGDRYQVSRERARQLEKRMLDRLKKYLEAELGSAVDIGELTRD